MSVQLFSCLAYQEGAKQFVVVVVVFQFPVTTVSKGRPPKKTVKRMTSCKKEGGGWVKFIISNSLKRMTIF